MKRRRLAGSVKRIIGRKLGMGRKRDRASEKKRKKRSEGSSEGCDSEGKGEGANLTMNAILRFEEEGIKRIDLFIP